MSQITLEVAKLPYVQIGTKRFGALDVYQAVQRYNHPLANAQGRPIPKSRQIQLGWIILAAAFVHLRMESRIQSLQKRLSDPDNSQSDPAIEEMQQALASKESRVTALETGLQSASDKLSDQIAERRSRLIERTKQLSAEAQQLLDRSHEAEPAVTVDVELSENKRNQPIVKNTKGLFGIIFAAQNVNNAMHEVMSTAQIIVQRYYDRKRAFSERNQEIVNDAKRVIGLLSDLRSELQLLMSMERAISEPIRNLLISHPKAITTSGQAIAEAFDCLSTIEKQFQSNLQIEDKLVQSCFDVEACEEGNLQPRSELSETIDPAEVTADRQFELLQALIKSAENAAVKGSWISRFQILEGVRIRVTADYICAFTIPPKELSDAVAQTASLILTYLHSLQREVHQVVENMGDLSQLAQKARLCSATELPTVIGELKPLTEAAKQNLDSLLTEKNWLKTQEIVKETERLLTSWLSQVDQSVASDPVLEGTWLMVGYLNDWVAETGNLWRIAGQIKEVYEGLCVVESTLLQAANEIKAKQQAQETAVEKVNGRIDALKKAQKSIEDSLLACTNHEAENDGIGEDRGTMYDQASFDLETRQRGQMLLQWHPTPQIDSAQEPDFVPFTQEIGTLFLDHCQWAKTKSCSPATLWKLLPSLAAHAEGLFQAANVTYEIDFMLQPPPIEINYVNS